jgi:hypothetical protein
MTAARKTAVRADAVTKGTWQPLLMSPLQVMEIDLKPAEML